MRNNIFYITIIALFSLNFDLSAQNLEINSNKIRYDTVEKVTYFEGNVNSKDDKGNKLFSEYAVYNKLDELIETKGETRVVTSKNYEILSSNVVFDNKNKIIYSDYKTEIKDKDGNIILVDMFSYSTTTSIFFSKGNITILDKNDNKYNFSEIYIDENKNKIIGSDIKAFLNQDGIEINSNNEPRFFANTMSSSRGVNNFDKGIFTYCKNRGEDKCPPWALQSKKIKHDLAKKTIYYENVILKVYDFPIFFAPRFSHPDPSVNRRSGLLAPSLSDDSTLGSGLSLPYFWNISDDRDLTFTPKLYLNENPLMLTEYRQDFKNSYLTVDAGYTRGYKNSNSKKKKGDKSHFFSNFNMSLINEEDKKSNFELNIEHVSNDTYLKIYDIETTLAQQNQTILDNNFSYSYQNEDFYFGLNPSIYEDTSKIGHSRDEYILPLIFEKNILSDEKLGFIDLATNLKVRSYDTNKYINLLVNDFNWKSNKSLNNFGIENRFESLVKIVNYEAEKTNQYKNDDTNTELSTALGYFAKLGLYKNDLVNKNFHTFTPRFLLRYSPGHMRNIQRNTERLNYGNLFNLNKTNQIDVIENGLNTSLGFEYKKNKVDKQNNIKDEVFSFSAGQVISAEENMDIPSSTSMDQRFSDVVGNASYNISNKINLNYKFSIDQSYKELNYNEIGGEFDLESAKFNVSYLQEKNHIGNTEFINTGLDYTFQNSTELSFSTKRNLLTSSSEFYNLSYNYINDCLKAGIAYRREFYTDRDIEPTTNLMFTISIIPFAQINSPSF